MSPIIGEIVMGILFGPNVANFVPYEQFFRLAGIFGVTLMIFESGMHLDFEMIKVVGKKACVVAVLGTFLPIISGIGLIYVFAPDMYTIWPVGLAVGVSLAPTSVGMALKMLGESKQLLEPACRLPAACLPPAACLQPSLTLAAGYSQASPSSSARATASLS